MKTKAMPYKCGSRKCDLCLAEKVILAWFKGVDLLNKQNELLSKYQHRDKFTIADIKWTIDFRCGWISNYFIVQISVEMCHCWYHLNVILS